MCLRKLLSPKIPTAPVPAAAPLVASYDNAEALAQADVETALRRRRAGPAANILTSAFGIPATPKLGGVAR
jgi:hypothetical protein